MRKPWDSFISLPAIYRLDYLFSRFKTHEHALVEDGRRVIGLFDAIEATQAKPSAIASFDVDAARDLKGRLRFATEKGVHIASLASSFAMRNLRRSAFSAASMLLAPYADSELIAFTVLNRKWVFTPDQLSTTSAAKIRNQLRRHLIRAGVHLIPGPLVAYLHGEFDPVAGVFVLHFHGLTLRSKKAAISSMSGKWGYVRTASRAVPIRCDPIRDRIEQGLLFAEKLLARAGGADRRQSD